MQRGGRTRTGPKSSARPEGRKGELDEGRRTTRGAGGGEGAGRNGRALEVLTAGVNELREVQIQQLKAEQERQIVELQLSSAKTELLSKEKLT